MLTEKDYCDYDTCVALKEIGYPLISKEVRYEDNAVFVPGVLLYSAQKWLREEHQIHIMVDRFGQDYMWCIKEKGAIGITHQEYEDYVNYESALLGGIKYAIKLLKGE